MCTYRTSHTKSTQLEHIICGMMREKGGESAGCRFGHTSLESQNLKFYIHNTYTYKFR